MARSWLFRLHRDAGRAPRHGTDGAVSYEYVVEVGGDAGTFGGGANTIDARTHSPQRDLRGPRIRCEYGRVDWRALIVEPKGQSVRSIPGERQGMRLVQVHRSERCAVLEERRECVTIGVVTTSQEKIDVHARAGVRDIDFGMGVARRSVARAAVVIEAT